MKTHFALMAQYNRRLNEQTFEAASHLDQEVLVKDKGAYFKSILGTLNHILVGDLNWLRRFAKHSSHYESLDKLADYPMPNKLDDILYKNFTELRRVRSCVDQVIIDWSTREAEQEDYDRAFEFVNSQGVSSTRNFGEVVSHFYNHQTHHRGQVSVLLSQLDLDVGVTDFLIDIPHIN